MFDSIHNANDFLSEHWLAEVFPSKLKDLAKGWKERAEQDKPTPTRGLSSIVGAYLKDLADLPPIEASEHLGRVTEVHTGLLAAVGFQAAATTIQTRQAGTPIDVPLLARFPSTSSTDSLHILQAVPVDSIDALLGGDAELIEPFHIHVTTQKFEEVTSVSDAVTQLFVSDDAPRYLLVIAGGVALLTDVARWAEGRYLGFDIATALDRRDVKAAGELAYHAGLWSSDVLLPDEDGKIELDHYTEDSEKHAVGVSEDLREGLRISIEKIANEVLARRRAAGLQVEGVPELPRDLTTQSLRFLYRVLFLLFAEARPELGVLPVGTPEYESGYGLDRLREMVQVPLAGSSAEGHHLHESLDRLFRLVNSGHNAGRASTDAFVFEPLRSDLFDPEETPLIDGEGMRLSNRVLQEVLNLLLLSKPSTRKKVRRGYISYAQLGINQLGAVYEGLMSYTGSIATDDMIEVAIDGDADKGSWLVPSTRSDEYAEKDIVKREDRLTGRKYTVRHPRGSFVFRLSGRDRQRSASYYTPEVLTKCVVKHALDELISVETPALDILEYRLCEPALGSGAFLNEAINQLAAEYLSRRQGELKMRIKPEEYASELQKVKAYLALHRAYGVDLNSTAVELAEVSLWLNVMHPGLEAPWFGLHLRRGNSLIGARRATYDLTSLGRARKSWLQTPPIDRPLSEGSINDGEIHHFLLPAAGWAAVASVKQSKDLAPAEADALKSWRTSITKKPSSKQTDRLRALATRVERLWALVVRRLEISEQQISRQIDVWGARTAVLLASVDRARVEEDLHDPEGPYERLRLAMDAWCALRFWPLSASGQDTADAHPVPPSLDEWILTLEELLGAAGVARIDAAQGTFHDLADDFNELALIDERDREFSGMRSIPDLLVRHRWLGIARNIAQDQGFFHWELDLASVFKRGGFDLVIGNPPWVRPLWSESSALAEFDPIFAFKDKSEEYAQAKMSILASKAGRLGYVASLTEWAATSEAVSSTADFAILSGIQSDLYMNFMVQSWRLASRNGRIGLVHREGHFSDPKAGTLRREVYRRLRLHAQFTNKLKLFSEVSSSREFSINIYGPGGEIDFANISNLFHPSTLDLSLVHNGEGAPPGLQDEGGSWSILPHRLRVTQVLEKDIAAWAKLVDSDVSDSSAGRMIRAFTSLDQNVLEKLGRFDDRARNRSPSVSQGWHETSRVDDGTIRKLTSRVRTERELVLQGNHLGLCNPYEAEPNENCKNRYDWSKLDAATISNSYIPRTNYRPNTDWAEYEARSDHWNSSMLRSNSSALGFWRVAWPMMIDVTTARTFRPAVIAPGVAHLNAVGSMAFPEVSSFENSILVVEFAGLWSSIVVDYLVKLRGKSNANADLVETLPSPSRNRPQLTLLLRHRSAKLISLTDLYAPLWHAVYSEDFKYDRWTTGVVPHAALSSSERLWSDSVPLRTELDRRNGLMELDVISAMILGLSVDELIQLFRSHFPGFRQADVQSYFDAKGNRIAKQSRHFGALQTRGDYEAIDAYMNGFAGLDTLNPIFSPFEAGAGQEEPWFYRPDREAEMRSAYADFEQRLAEA